MALLSRKLEQLVQLTTTHFEILNTHKFLSLRDRKRLKLSFLESLLNPPTRQVPGQNGNNGYAEAETANDFMTAKEVEAWLKIDANTIYHYVRLGIIPHLRVQRNVRFRRRDLQRRVTQHSRLPRAMKFASRK